MPPALPLIMPSSWQEYLRGSGFRQDEFIINSLYIAASSNIPIARINLPRQHSGILPNFFVVSGFPDMGYTVSSGFYPTGILATGLVYYRITKN